MIILEIVIIVIVLMSLYRLGKYIEKLGPKRKWLGTLIGVVFFIFLALSAVYLFLENNWESRYLESLSFLCDLGLI